MSRKNLLALGLVCVLTLGALTGCQSKAASANVSVVQESEAETVESKTEESTTEESTTEESTTQESQTEETYAQESEGVPASSEAQTEESQPEESKAEEVTYAQETESVPASSEAETVESKPVESKAQKIPYAQEHGWKFSDLSPLEMPIFVYWTDSDYNYTENGPEGVTIIQPTAVYTVNDIAVSGPYEDGMVQYMVACEANFEIAFEDPEMMDLSLYGVLGKGFELVDLYTGTVLPYNGNLFSTLELDVVWDDVTYPIVYRGWNTPYFGDWQKDGITKCSVRVVYKYVIVVPADYDGLVLFINNNGQTEYGELADMSVPWAFEELMSEEGTTVDDYKFIRISDYARQFE
jgi:hypothetical protein